MDDMFATEDGYNIRLSVDESDYEVTAFDVDTGLELGRINFQEIELEGHSVLLITWAHIEAQGNRYKRQGIGRRALALVKEISGLTIVARPDDGKRRDDGSHLTGDAPGWVSAMRKAGLIHPEGFD